MGEREAKIDKKTFSEAANTNPVQSPKKTSNGSQIAFIADAYGLNANESAKEDSPVSQFMDGYGLKSETTNRFHVSESWRLALMALHFALTIIIGLTVVITMTPGESNSNKLDDLEAKLELFEFSVGYRIDGVITNSDNKLNEFKLLIQYRVDNDRSYVYNETTKLSTNDQNLNAQVMDIHFRLLHMQFGSADALKCKRSGGVASAHFNKCYFMLSRMGFHDFFELQNFCGDEAVLAYPGTMSELQLMGNFYFNSLKLGVRVMFPVGLFRIGEEDGRLETQDGLVINNMTVDVLHQNHEMHNKGVCLTQNGMGGVPSLTTCEATLHWYDKYICMQKLLD